MSADQEWWPPPDDSVTFESLCLDLWADIWGPASGAEKNGRPGQAQAGVDVCGQSKGRWIGVQCKQKDGLLRLQVSVKALEQEVQKAAGFRPKLSLFILATTGPADANVQKRARELSTTNRVKQLFRVEVWDWNRIWREIYQREKLLNRIGPIYWPRLFGIRGKQRIAPSRLTHVAEELVGRDAELARLEAYWQDPKVNVVTLVAWGGVGKSSLVATWGAGLAERRFDGADYFDWSFYSQGTREQGGASSDTFVAEALRHFDEPEMAASAVSGWDKGAKLAQLVAERRALLILDGLEPLQYPPGPLAGQLKDPAVTSLLKGLAQKNAGLCVVTTREGVMDLARYRRGTAPEWELEQLATAAGVRLLKRFGVWGSEIDLEELVEDVHGHALTLNLLGSYLSKAHSGDVRKRDRVDLHKADMATQGGHAFKAMAAYERWLGEGAEEGARQLVILRLMGLFDRPADSVCLAALRKPPAIPGLTEPLVELPEEDWNLTCSALRESHLLAPIPSGAGQGELSADGATLDAHPLVREYFALRLRKEQPEAWRAAHSRLYEYFRDSTKPYQPDTLEGLQPLYQALVHGCLARRHEEARVDIYRDRILRGTEGGGFYSTKNLGAFGTELSVLASFFEPPWSRVSPEVSDSGQAWLLNQSGVYLRALGRLVEALEPIRTAQERFENQSNWKQAAKCASNLSEVELSLGRVQAALRSAKLTVVFADRSCDSFELLTNRTTLAECLHQAGNKTEALELCRRSEQMQAEMEDMEPLLYSLPGFRFCSLLLADAERIAWNDGNETADLEALKKCVAEVEERALAALKIAERNYWLLSLALDHLTLGRARLYRAILENAQFSFANSEIELAVVSLRRASSMHFTPLGLLTRAWLRALQGNPSGAEADLAEAQEIAERGPMPLYLADVHLHRARLFRDRAALASARALIEKHGYWRRKEELEDAEAAALEWAPTNSPAPPSEPHTSC